MNLQPFKTSKGFILIPVLIFMFSTVVVGGIASFTKLTQIENKIKNTNTQITLELSQLHKINQQDRNLKEKLAKYSRLGVEVGQISAQTVRIRELILAKDFDQTQVLLSQLDHKLEQALSGKIEAERKVAVQDRDSLEIKVVEFAKKGINVEEVDRKLPEIRGLIDNREFTKARDLVATFSARLDQLLNLKLEEERKAEAAKITAAPQATGGVTYARKTVSTLRGNFSVDVLTINLATTKVITDTANSEDCDNNCPTKPLASFVNQNSGIAGINGTYFCPPDYIQCAGKVASFDFPVYNTRLGKFFNSRTLFWSGRAMIAFDTSGKAYFFREANSFGGVNIKAAIVNYPALLSDGAIVVDESSLSDKLGKIKGNRGALGFTGNTLLAVIGRGATVGDMAYVMAAIGAEHAMNLDGGGSSALYFNGSYKVGPGRNLPNAVVFSR